MRSTRPLQLQLALRFGAILADKRQVGVFVIGFAAFLQLWSIQALLPTLATVFHADEAEVSLTVSATTIAVTLMAPFIGIAADILGRRRIITIGLFLLVVPTALIASATTLNEIVLYRFIQGLLLPPVFVVAVAYIGDEFPRNEITAVTATYTTGSIVGGFLGRFIAGWVGEYGGWRTAYLVLAAIDLVCVIYVATQLPRERHFVRAAGLARTVVLMVRHFRDR
ncbi:MAG: MFS transporter, partial [Stellaceae bacterium]